MVAKLRHTSPDISAARGKEEVRLWGFADSAYVMLRPGGVQDADGRH